MMISDHGEDNIEHRQTGKNNMYDSASRVAMIMSGQEQPLGRGWHSLGPQGSLFVRRPTNIFSEERELVE